MKIFVFSDNAEIFTRVRPILEIYARDAYISYFCYSRDCFGVYCDVIARDLKGNIDDLLEYDIGFSIHSRQIFPQQLVSQVLCINLHPGYNPYNRGIYPHIFSLINHLPTGATLHIMDASIDSGAIIARKIVNIESNDTSLSLYRKILDCEVKLFEKYLPKILQHDFIAIKTKSEGNYNSKSDFKRLCEIDLERHCTMREAIDYLRAMSHTPYQNAYFIDNGKKYFVNIQISTKSSTSIESKWGGGISP